jgi:hypothetical protein
VLLGLILYLGLRDPQWQLLSRQPADTEENENEHDRGSNPERTAADSFSSFFYHSIATGAQYIRRVSRVRFGGEVLNIMFSDDARRELGRENG